MDSRGHGRSTRDARPYRYDLMADDVVALLDTLHIAKADVVGWSDGAILGLDLAIRYPDRVGTLPSSATTPASRRCLIAPSPDRRSRQR
jgi:pimeloyl-ACP methyl ester carboxylesterase